MTTKKNAGAAKCVKWEPMDAKMIEEGGFFCAYSRTLEAALSDAKEMLPGWKGGEKNMFIVSWVED